jgi:hypothetical protein
MILPLNSLVVGCYYDEINFQGDGVFSLRNVNIVRFYYVFNCATCFGHTTIFKHTYFSRTYSIDNESVVFFIILVVIANISLH